MRPEQRNRHRETMAAVSRLKSLESRELYPLPPVADPVRRAEALSSPRAWNEIYLAKRFNKKWASFHYNLMDEMEKVIRHGGKVSVAIQRGGGKTTITEGVAGWAIASGLRRFIITLAKNKDEATGLLDNIKRIFDGTPDVLADFPEICYSIHRLNGSNLLARGQVYLGQNTNTIWKHDNVVFPTVPGSIASGARIRTVGMRGAIRGKNMMLPTGEKVRPDFVFIDDIQDADSAINPNTVAKYRNKLETDVEGLVGPGETMAEIMTCTVIAPDDLADQYLTQGKRPPLWQGLRFKMVEQMPTNMRLWDEYRNLLHGEGLEVADRFYKQNRKDMDEGAIVPWADNYDKTIEFGALHKAMKIWANSELTFYSEYQNDPPIANSGTMLTDAATIRKRINGMPRGVLPSETEKLTGFIDVHDDVLYWCVAAWADDFTGWIVDYGTFPEQNRAFFSKSDKSLSTMKSYFKGRKDARVRQGLEYLAGELTQRVWSFEHDPLFTTQIDRLLIDSRYLHRAVDGALRNLRNNGVIRPAMGIGITENKKPINNWPKKDGRKIGHYWIDDRPARRTFRTVTADVNYWKGQVHDAFALEAGDRGGLTLWGKSGEKHRMFSEHCDAESVVAVQGLYEVDKWTAIPTLDNHFFDCIVGCMVAASHMKIKLPSETRKSTEYTDETPLKLIKKRKPISREVVDLT